MTGLVYKRISMLSPFTTLLRYIQPVSPLTDFDKPQVHDWIHSGGDTKFPVLCCQ